MDRWKFGDTSSEEVYVGMENSATENVFGTDKKEQKRREINDMGNKEYEYEWDDPSIYDEGTSTE